MSEMFFCWGPKITSIPIDVYDKIKNGNHRQILNIVIVLQLKHKRG